MFAFLVMASSDGDLEENLKCSVCLDFFKEPELLQCSHSFCKVCLENYWSRKPEKNCPICRTKTKRCTNNLALKSICESFVEVKRRRISEQNQGAVCSVHKKKHEMFCTDDKKLVCLSCVTQDHKDHNFCSISKAAEDHRNDLQGPLQECEKKLETLTSTKAKYFSSYTKLQAQTQQTEKQIKEEFEKLHQFLREEEQVRINALRNEEETKQKEIMKKTVEIEKLISDLTERINKIKEDLKNEDSLFLHKFRETEKRTKLPVPDPEHRVWINHHVDVAKHLGNLKFSLWEKMKDFCPHYPVILDPNTKSSSLQVSQDLTSITCAPTPGLQKLPKQCLQYVLGSEGFSSGDHTWQVDVNSCEHWLLGIVKESQKSVFNISNCPYTVSVISGKCSWNSVVPYIENVCVSLDMDNGQLKFTDADTNTTFRVWTGQFTEKMYPCFFVHGNSLMRILPVAAS